MKKKYEMLTVYGKTEEIKYAQDYAEAIEEGRWIARDLCGADPEVITPTKFVEYVNTKFPQNAEIKVNVADITEDAHPMMAAVERANEGPYFIYFLRRKRETMKLCTFTTSFRHSQIQGKHYYNDFRRCLRRNPGK